MDPTWKKRQPRLRSPAELRAFYAIALSRGNNGDSRSVFSPSRASSDRSSGSTSLFSGQASAVSSATSIGDSKRVDALSLTTEHEVPTTAVTLYSSYSHTPDTQTIDISIATVSEAVGEGLESPPGQTKSDVARRQDDIREDLLHLKSLRLETACQRYADQYLACDKVRPCCRNCEQNNQQCPYHRDEATNCDERSRSPTETPVEACLDPLSWLNTLREHPYRNLERDQKLNRVDAWRLKSRRWLLFRNQKDNPHNQSAEIVEEDSLATSQLMLDSNSHFDDETFPIAEVDDTRDDADSLLTPTYCYPPNDGCDSSGRTILLDLGASFSRGKSTDSLCLSQRSVSPSSECHFQAPRPKELGDVVEMFTRISRQRVARNSFDESISFYCVFCFECFGNRTDWEDHELSQHLEKQRDWICMPWGPVEKYEEDGEEFCVFCDIASPSESHYLEHNGDSCARKSTRERTFRRKEDLENHFWHMHGHRELPDYLNPWSFEPEYEDWYWQCGFCDKSTSGWTDRVRHIGNHFEDGLSMLCWDPSVTACPISKSTGSLVAWVPAVNKVREIRQILKPDEFSQMSKTQHHCENCNMVFRNREEAKLHHEKWHLPRDIWICPTKNDLRTAAYLQTGPLASYLFPSITLLPKSSKPKPDVCPYCGDYAEDIFEDYDDDLKDCFADWKIRVQHLVGSHSFDSCRPGTSFYRSDQFLLHLAGTHNLRLNDWTKEVMDSCKRTELLPQKVVDIDVLSLTEDDDESAC